MNAPVRTSARGGAVELLWLVPLGVVVVLGSFFTNLAEEHAAPTTYQPWLAAGVALAAVLGLLGALRRPLPGAAATCAAVTLFVALDLRDGPVYLTLAAAAFLVSIRVPVREWSRVVVAGTAAVGAALVVRAVADFDNERSLWQLVAILGVVAAGSALGTLTRSRAATLSARAQAAAAGEQLRMAQELHDGVGHGLAVIAMQAGVGLHVLDDDPAAARRSLEAIRDSAREALDSLRTELAQLAGGPAPRRPGHGTADLPDLVERVRAAGLEVTVSGSAGDLAGPVDAVVYGVVQEGLTNVLRHASATAVAVRLDRSAEELAVTVEDDGQGAPAADGPDEGMGLRGMRERIEALGGRLSATSRPSGGFAVRAVLPL